MSLYTAYIVDSPLTENVESLIRIRKRDLSPDPVQRRMMLIVIFVVLAVSTFALYLPRLITAEKRAESIRNLKGESAQSDDALPPIAGDLSPVFSAEVQHWRDDILRWAAAYEVDPDIVATIMQIESCGDPGAISGAGARGLFQVMPFHFSAGEDMLDPETNARRGLAYYQQQMKETAGNVYLSFAGYNGGSAASSSGWSSWVDETRRYYVWSQGIYDEAKAGLDASPTLQRWMEAGGTSLCRQAASRLGLGSGTD